MSILKNIKGSASKGLASVQSEAKKIGDTVAPKVAQGIGTATTKAEAALTAGKNAAVQVSTNARDTLVNQLDANHDGNIDIEDIIVFAMKTPGIKVNRSKFLKMSSESTMSRK